MEQWLSLSEVAKILGVHPSTVRNWANQGKIPVHRTPGGHRRFLRREVEFWQQANSATSADESEQVIRNALRQTRYRVSEGILEQQPWYSKLDEDTRYQYRLSGRSLLQALSNYLSSGDEQTGAAEARSLGYEYAVRARRASLNITEATEAFLFFRNSLLDAMYDVYESAAVRSSSSWSTMFQRITAFTDRVLLALLEVYTAFQNGSS